MATAIAAIPGTVFAAGLGKITVLSGLGQPLSAEVDLTAGRDELSGLKATIAPADAFRQAGIEYAPALTGIQISVEKKPDGRPYLKLTSNRPINDPFLDMLIEVNWSQGRLRREYTFLLDPPAEAITPAPIAVTPGLKPAEAVAQPAPVAPRPEPEVRAAAPVDEALPAKQPEPKAEPAAPDGESREVKRGDTLGKIAAETGYDGVNLDQMLVAIFRDNKAAFINENMNRMRTGKILQIPSRDEVSSVDPAEARRTVRAQAADFNAYRRKLAEAARALEVPNEQAAQAASGKITAKVEDRIPPPTETKDQLQVSRSEAGKETKALQGKLVALEEDSVAKEKALQEASARVAELEKNVKDLQKLLGLKNQSLAELQKQASAAARPEAAEPAPVAPAAPAPKPEETKTVVAEKPAAAPPAVEPVEAVQPVAQAATPAPDKPAAPAKPTAKKPKAPPPPPEPSFIEDLMDNPLMLAGGAAILGLLGLLGIRQRRKAGQDQTEASPSTTSVNLATNSVFGSTGGQSVDTSASSMQTDFSQASISAIDADEGVDPVAEADVYMAYGRDAQAEEILLDALKSDPGRTAIHAKLLEIHAARKNMKQFETLAGELYAQTGGVGADWEKAAALGLKLDPGNPLYGGAPKPEIPASPPPSIADTTVIVGSPEELAAAWAAPEAARPGLAQENPFLASTVVLDKATVEAARSEPSPPSLDFDLELGEPAAAKPAEAGTAQPPTAAGLDFDLGLDFELTGANAEPEAAAAVSREEPLDLEFKLPDMPDTGSGSNMSSLDFDLDLSPASPAVPAPGGLKQAAPAGAVDFDFDLNVEPVAAPPPAKALDLSSIGLNLDQPQIDIDVAEPDGEDEQEVTTKLELAKAYEEMGDREGARELLQEVMKEGDATHQKRAREMLAALA